jgi:ion channel-forming bestrophin family protein
MVDYDPKNWSRIIFHWRGSVMLALVPRIVVCSVIGGLAAWLFESRQFKVPTLIHTMLGVVLGLLLVFRTNASYDRYWEGRKLMGSFVNRARDLVRQAVGYVDGDDDAARADRAEIRRLVIVFFALLRQYLRKERDLDVLGASLSADERAALEPVVVRPNLAALWLTQRIASSARAGRIGDERVKLLDANVTTLVDVWGGAERIMRTPIPFAYAQHIKTFLTVFCFTAPFAMVESMKWYTPLAAAVLAFGMFGIDEIGVEIEDPFGYDANDLPLDVMNKRIEEDTAAILAQRDRPRVAVAA